MKDVGLDDTACCVRCELVFDILICLGERRGFAEIFLIFVYDRLPVVETLLRGRWNVLFDGTLLWRIILIFLHLNINN